MEEKNDTLAKSVSIDDSLRTKAMCTVTILIILIMSYTILLNKKYKNLKKVFVISNYWKTILRQY